MKKSLVRLFAFLLILPLVMVGCAPSANNANPPSANNANPPAANSSAPPATENAAPQEPATVQPKPFKLAVALGDSGASIFAVMGNNVKKYVETAGGTVVFERTGFSADTQIAFVENQISAGVNGIVIAPATDAVANTINTLCEEAGVYWGIPFRSIVDEQIKEIVEGSQYYVGNCYEDEKDTAYGVMQELNNIGVKKVAYISMAVGDTTAGRREEGMNQGAQEFGIEIVAEARALNQATDVTSAVESFLSAHSDLDAVFILATAAAGALKAAGKAITDSGRGNTVKLACIDFQEGMVDLFGEGIMAVASGLPHWGYDPFMTVVKVSNAAMATPISDTNFSTPMKMLRITNVDMATKYEETFASDDKLYYSPEEMASLLIKANNPDLNEEAFQFLVNTFNPLA